MKTFSRSLFPALACVLFLTACGGSSDDDSSPATQAFVPDPEPATSFFNDDSGTDFVNNLLGRFLGVLRPLSGLLDDDDDFKSAIAKRTIARTETLADNCSGGGSFTISGEFDDVTDELISLDGTLNNCIEDGETSNGSLSITSNLDDSGDNGTVSLTVDNLTVTGGEENIALDGTVNVEVQSNGVESTFTISGPNFSMTVDDESLSFSDYSVSAVSNDFTDSSSLSASMTISSSVDGIIMFVIDPPLADDGFSEFPLSGVITLTHADGSSLALNAGNGNPETFDFTINDNGSITTGSQRWDETDLGDL